MLKTFKSGYLFDLLMNLLAFITGPVIRYMPQAANHLLNILTTHASIFQVDKNAAVVFCKKELVEANDRLLHPRWTFELSASYGFSSDNKPRLVVFDDGRVYDIHGVTRGGCGSMYNIYGELIILDLE
jgi:hypothetical protein